MKRIIKASEFYEQRKRIQKGIKNVETVAKLLHFWALYQAYSFMIPIVEKAKDWPGLRQEIERAPELLDLFLDHLKNAAHLHIDIHKDSIFNEDIIGKVTLQQWQNTGYKMNRPKSTYLIRLAIWKKLYRGKKKGITYEEVIAKRNTAIPDDLKPVPYYFLWNVGNKGSTSGFPEYKGLHYLDRAQAQIPNFKRQAMNYLEDYALSILDNTRAAIPPFQDTTWFKAASAYFDIPVESIRSLRKI